MANISIFLCLLFSGFVAVAQTAPQYQYVFKIDLDSRVSYSKYYKSIDDAIHDPILLLLGVTYQKDVNSFKLHGDGVLSVNEVAPYVRNMQHENKPLRTGLEMEINEISSDSMNISLVYWKDGVRTVMKEKGTYGTVPEEVYINSNKSTTNRVVQEQFITLDKPLKWGEYTTLSNKTWNFDKAKNKITVINFWFVGCAPCIREMPELNQLVDKYADKDVEFIAFGLDNEESIQEFLAKKPFHYTIIPNSKETAQKFGITSFPTHLILDKNGVVRYHKVGYDESIDEELSEILEELL